MAPTPADVVIVGGGLAGLRVAESLRSREYAGTITIVTGEEHLPYDRPPLSKQFLQGTWDADKIRLTAPADLEERGIDVRRGVPAVGLEGRVVTLADGTRLTADAVVLATGSTPIRPADWPPGVRTLRTLDDAQDLREGLSAGQTLLIVGAGFIGAEVAHVARTAGVEVVLVDAAAVPCERVLGPVGGALIARLIVESGASLHLGARIAAVVDEHTVRLDDGTELTADTVLVAIGATPTTQWLDENLTDGRGGIPCDADGRVIGLDGVWAVGDIAAWADAVQGGHIRSEHWTSAVDQAEAVAAHLVGAAVDDASIPYVWSDQHGLKIQVFGRTEAADDVVTLFGDGTTGGPVKGTVLGYFTGDTLVAVAGFGAPAKLIPLRALIAEGADRATVLERVAPVVAPS